MAINTNVGCRTHVAQCRSLASSATARLVGTPVSRGPMTREHALKVVLAPQIGVELCGQPRQKKEHSVQGHLAWVASIHRIDLSREYAKCDSRVSHLGLTEGGAMPLTNRGVVRSAVRTPAHARLHGCGTYKSDTSSVELCLKENHV